MCDSRELSVVVYPTRDQSLAIIFFVPDYICPIQIREINFPICQRELTDKIFCNIYGIRFQMYYKMRILPVIFLFSMMTKAQDNFILGFLIHGVNLILNKGMTGIWIARRYWLFFYIEEPIYPSVYHVFWGGARLFLTIFFFHC